MGTPTFYGGGSFTGGYQVTKKVSSAFTGATNAHGDTATFETGDVSATNATYTLFQVVGIVWIKILFGYIKTDCASAGSGTISLGVTGLPVAITSASQAAVSLDEKDIFFCGGGAGAPNMYASVASVDINATAPGAPWEAIAANTYIIETTNTSDITAGQIDYYCIWAPISDGAYIVAV